MTKRATDELSSIHKRIDSIRMTESERQVALAAMRDAFIIVEGCAWLVQKIRLMRAPSSLKPRLAH